MEPYVSSEDFIIAREGEANIHNVNDEHGIGGGRGGNRGGGKGVGRGRGASIGDPEHFEFPIFDEDTTAIMKNISPAILRNFHGLRNDVSKTFLFEFEVLCRSYDYFLGAQNFKLFPATLKDATLKWFMGLGTHYI